jgi:hypothetical protein
MFSSLLLFFIVLVDCGMSDVVVLSSCTGHTRAVQEERTTTSDIRQSTKTTKNNSKEENISYNKETEHSINHNRIDKDKQSAHK